MEKTPDEIKKGLECCISDTYGCNEKCPYFNSLSNGVDCAVKMHADALAYIQQLETANDEALTRVEQLEAKCNQLERERDAAVGELRGHCAFCKHNYHNAPKCRDCDEYMDKWEWRGVKEE